MKSIVVETTLRGRNQLTVPKEIAEAFGLREGQRLTFALDPGRPDEIVVRPMRESYAGILTGVFGVTDAEREAYVKGERDSWI
jgi:AbrB family looped-hinge helix DNA binding protein